MAQIVSRVAYVIHINKTATLVSPYRFILRTPIECLKLRPTKLAPSDAIKIPSSSPRYPD